MDVDGHYGFESQSDVACVCVEYGESERRAAKVDLHVDVQVGAGARNEEQPYAIASVEVGDEVQVLVITGVVHRNDVLESVAVVPRDGVGRYADLLVLQRDDVVVEDGEVQHLRC